MTDGLAKIGKLRILARDSTPKFSFLPADVQRTCKTICHCTHKSTYRMASKSFERSEQSARM